MGHVLEPKAIRGSDLFALSRSARRQSFHKRLALFTELLRHRAIGPRRLYGRCISSPMDREVVVEDPVSGEQRRMLMFGSNNYLGLANHPEVVRRVVQATSKYGIGMGGPPLFNGTSKVHRQLEERLCLLKGKEAAVLFSSGYGANVGMVSALAKPTDHVISDANCHASFVDGVRLAGCRAETFRHNDVEALQTRLTKAAETEGDTFVGVEGVYSVGGDLAPLDRIAPMCRRAGALLIVDDAHGTGIIGPGGAGTAEHFGVEADVDVVVGTFSKVFAGTGGFVAASEPIVDMIRFSARSHVFSASPAPTVVEGVLAGLDVLEREPHHLIRLKHNQQYASAALAAEGIEWKGTTPIMAIPVPRHLDVFQVATALHDEGLFINAVVYPATPRDCPKLRLSLMAQHTHDDIDRMAHALGTQFSQ